MKSRKIITALVSAGVLSLGLVACADSGGLHTDSGGLHTDSGVRVFVEDQEPQGYMDALIEGVIDTNESGCLVIRDDVYGTESEHVPIFPYGTSIEGDAIVFQDVRVTFGDRISLGGGGTESDRSTIYQSCGTGNVWYGAPHLELLK